MLFRAVALSLALLLGIGTIIPLTTTSTEAGPKYKRSKKKKLKKYSKAWWRWYHRKQRKARVLLARKRALKAKQILYARLRGQVARQNLEIKQDEKGTKSATNEPSNNKNNPLQIPIQIQPISSDLQFRVNDNNGSEIGTASLSIIGFAEGTDSKNANDKIGGVTTRSLLRNAVEQILKEQGWIVNDFQKEINDKKVYIVTGHSLVNGVPRSHYFYFTEVGGKIYRLSTTCPKEAKEQIARESEKVIQSLMRGNLVSQSFKK